MTRIAYLDCVGGMSGDMVLGALVDGGASIERLAAVPGLLGLEDVDVEARRVERQGIGALQVEVRAPPRTAHRPFGEIRGQIRDSGLPERVRALALEAFTRLAAVEGAIHGVPSEAVEFHELGGLDTLVDICGAMALVEELALDRVVCSPLPYARGLTAAGHGVLPLPAPATLALLVGAPLVGVEADAELVTPTAAAIAATVVDAWGPLPALTLEAVGYGAGSRDLAERPNVLRVVLGPAAATPAQAEVVLLETNLDDLNPQLVPDAVERCTAAGALDVWVAPVQMKKGRPGIVLSALARPGQHTAVAEAMLAETTTLGIRVARLGRIELDRDEVTVSVPGGAVRIKVGRLGGRVVNVAPEHDDCLALARATGQPVKAVWAAALAAAGRL